jgi:GntR family transcriptional regulator
VLGTLSANDSVPSVRQLATELRINPNTVSQAYRELEREGVLEVRRGHGTHVANSWVGDDQRRALASQVAARALQDALMLLGTMQMTDAVASASRIWFGYFGAGAALGGQIADITRSDTTGALSLHRWLSAVIGWGASPVDSCASRLDVALSHSAWRRHDPRLRRLSPAGAARDARGWQSLR